MDHKSGLTALEQAVFDLLQYCQGAGRQLTKGRDLSQALLGRPFEREQDDALLAEAVSQRITEQIGIWRQSRGLKPDDELRQLTAEERLRIDLGAGNSRLEVLSLVRAYYLEQLSKDVLMQILSLQKRQVEAKLQAGRREVYKLVAVSDSPGAAEVIEEQEEHVDESGGIAQPEPELVAPRQVNSTAPAMGWRRYLRIGNVVLLTVLVGMVAGIAALFTSQKPDLNPLQSEVLYQADWSKGRIDWLGFDGWKTIDGMLVHDGSSETMQIIAPYEPKQLTNYAVEAEVQVVGQMAEEKSFGIIARGEKRTEGQNKSYVGYFGVIGSEVFRISGDQLLKSHPLKQTPAWFNEWHTYRLEVEGTTIRLFVDNTLVVETMDNKYVTGGRLGLWSNETQLNVRAFKVIKL